MSLPSLLPAATFQLTTSFDHTFDDTLAGSIIGAGLLTYTAETALADGAYAWDSLVAPAFVAQFGEGESGLVFSADSSSPGYFGMAGAVVEVRGSSFFFSWLGSGGESNEYGLIYLENESIGRALLFEPVPPSNWSGSTSLTEQYIIIDTATGDHVLGGDYGVASAIPEPSTYALMAGAATLGLVVIRRRRTRRG